MKRIAMFTLLLAMVLAADTENAAAQNQIGVNAGYNLDAEEFFLGGQFRFSPLALPIIINPSVETYFIEDLGWLQIDVNALYPFGVDNTTFTPYAGAGLGVDYVTPEGGDGDPDAGLNLIFGANWGMANLQPFTEARIHVDSEVGVGIRGGILLGI